MFPLQAKKRQKRNKRPAQKRTNAVVENIRRFFRLPEKKSPEVKKKYQEDWCPKDLTFPMPDLPTEATLSEEEEPIQVMPQEPTIDFDSVMLAFPPPPPLPPAATPPFTLEDMRKKDSSNYHHDNRTSWAAPAPPPLINASEQPLERSNMAFVLLSAALVLVLVGFSFLLQQKSSTKQSGFPALSKQEKHRNQTSKRTNNVPAALTCKQQESQNNRKLVATSKKGISYWEIWARRMWILRREFLSRPYKMDYRVLTKKVKATTTYKNNQSTPTANNNSSSKTATVPNNTDPVNTTKEVVKYQSRDMVEFCSRALTQYDDSDKRRALLQALLHTVRKGNQNNGSLFLQNLLPPGLKPHNNSVNHPTTFTSMASSILSENRFFPAMVSAIANNATATTKK